MRNVSAERKPWRNDTLLININGKRNAAAKWVYYYYYNNCMLYKYTFFFFFNSRLAEWLRVYYDERVCRCAVERSTNLLQFASRPTPVVDVVDRVCDIFVFLLPTLWSRRTIYSAVHDDWRCGIRVTDGCVILDKFKIFHKFKLAVPIEKWPNNETVNERILNLDNCFDRKFSN